MKRQLALHCACALLVAVAGCGRSSANRAMEVDARFASFVDQYFESYFEFYPSEATAAGLHEYDSKLEDWSAPRWPLRSSELKRQLTLLEDLTDGELSADNRIDAEILSARIRAELQDIDKLRHWRRNPLMYAVIPGAAIDGLVKRNFASPLERVRLATARLADVKLLMSSMHNNLGDAPPEFVELAIRTLRGSIPFFRDSLPAWARRSAGADRVSLANFDIANQGAIRALEAAVQYLERDVLPLATAQFAIGEDAFREKLLNEEMVDIPLERLRTIGEANLDADYRAFVETARRLAPGRTPAEAMRLLADEHPREEDLMASAQRRADAIRDFVVARNLVPIPSDVRPAIVPTPPFLRAMGFAFMDTPGAYEPHAREAFYYITPPEPDWTPEHKQEHLRLFNRSVMDIITIHEAWPGHYVQFLYASQFPTKTRKLISCGTNAEGWAHYAEQMMLESGYGDGDPKVRLAQLAEALVRDVRFISAIKLHTERWTVDQSKRLFMQMAFLDEANALQEAMRGTYNPTYLYYTLGKLQIYKLRSDLQQRKGASFRIEDFHRDFVRQGALPIPLVRRILLGPDNGPSL